MGGGFAGSWLLSAASSKAAGSSARAAAAAWTVVEPVTAARIACATAR